MHTCLERQEHALVSRVPFQKEVRDPQTSTNEYFYDKVLEIRPVDAQSVYELYEIS